MVNTALITLLQFPEECDSELILKIGPGTYTPIEDYADSVLLFTSALA